MTSEVLSPALHDLLEAMARAVLRQTGQPEESVHVSEESARQLQELSERHRAEIEAHKLAALEEIRAERESLQALADQVATDAQQVIAATRAAETAALASLQAALVAHSQELDAQAERFEAEIEARADRIEQALRELGTHAQDQAREQIESLQTLARDQEESLQSSLTQARQDLENTQDILSDKLREETQAHLQDGLRGLETSLSDMAGGHLQRLTDEGEQVRHRVIRLRPVLEEVAQLLAEQIPVVGHSLSARLEQIDP